MTDLPPGPFTWITTARPGEHDGNGHVYIVDANGRKMAAIYSTDNGTPRFH